MYDHLDKREVSGLLDSYNHLVELCDQGMLYEAADWLAAGHSAARPAEAKHCPLRIACGKDFHSLVKLLLRYDCNEEQKLHGLAEASEAGSLEICKLLVEAGAPVARLDYWHLDRVVNRPLIEYLLDHGLDLTRKDGLAKMLTYCRIKPLLGLFLQHRHRFPGWEKQAAKALCEFVRKRDLKWISLMVWAKADPLLNVSPLVDDTDDENDGWEENDDWKENAVEIALNCCDPEIFSMLKLKLTPAQATEALHAICSVTDQTVLETLLGAGADPNALDPEQASLLHRILSSFGWHCYGLYSRHDPRKDVELIAWLIREGAKWIPPENERSPDSLRRNFYRGEPKLVVEVIRLLDAGNVCEKNLLRKLVDKPKMRAWVTHHEPELLDRLLNS